MRPNSSFGGGVLPGRPDASARRPYHMDEEFCSHPVTRDEIVTEPPLR